VGDHLARSGPHGKTSGRMSGPGEITMTTTTAIPQHSSESNEHYTPSKIIEVCRETMGTIDLDPASCKLANDELVHATSYFTKEHDGLTRPWHGNVFCNPPGGKYRMIDGKFTPVSKGPGDSSAATWFYKAVAEWKLGRAVDVCFLGFTLELLRITQARPPSAACFPFCLLKDRTDFLCETADGKLIAQGSPTHANVLVLISNDPAVIARFINARVLGEVVIPQKMVVR